MFVKLYFVIFFALIVGSEDPGADCSSYVQRNPNSITPMAELSLRSNCDTVVDSGDVQSLGIDCISPSQQLSSLISIQYQSVTNANSKIHSPPIIDSLQRRRDSERASTDHTAWWLTQNSTQWAAAPPKPTLKNTNSYITPPELDSLLVGGKGNRRLSPHIQLRGGGDLGGSRGGGGGAMGDHYDEGEALLPHSLESRSNNLTNAVSPEM